ncbi:hypothetical protein BpHYR1_009712 [Brachionus plicatilis]|uniref:Uncharacterized protein n=1 Tax=Brachionus plicatilis TaxID=10195 RepID=A0A3M7QDG1_BRAPC|nr:hypothetical protein BpHYR1_009712 [Brachionus plicatilis]
MATFLALRTAEYSFDRFCYDTIKFNVNQLSILFFSFLYLGLMLKYGLRSEECSVKVSLRKMLKNKNCSPQIKRILSKNFLLKLISTRCIYWCYA